MMMRLVAFCIAILFVGTTYVSSSIELSVVFQDGTLPTDRLESAPQASLLKTSSGAAAWSPSSSINQATIESVQTSTLTLSSYSGDPEEVTITGSIANTKGSRVFGSGTLFTTELQRGDVVVWGGKEIEVAVVTSDTEFTAKEIVHAWESDYSPVEVLGLYMSDQRDSAVTSTTLQIPLPQAIHPYWSVNVIGIAKNGAAVTPTLTWDGGPHSASGSSNLTGNGYYGYNWRIDGTSHPDTPFATLEFSVDVASRLALVAWVTSGTSAGGGESSDTDSTLEATLIKNQPNYLAVTTCIVDGYKTVEPDWTQTYKYRSHWFSPRPDDTSFGILTVSSDVGQAYFAGLNMEFFFGLSTYYTCGSASFGGRNDHTTITRKRGWVP
jgi:hypothetical protein